MKQHSYQVRIDWTGNTGDGTSSYKSYSRSHSISAEDKYQEILSSSDPGFQGDKSKYNPEELFLSSISACHMLWYLHLCSANKIIVTAYKDKARAIMVETDNGSGKFKEASLHPVVKIKNPDLKELANELHTQAHKMCFIANSCNFDITHHPKIIIE